MLEIRFAWLIMNLQFIYLPLMFVSVTFPAHTAADPNS
jgi:hypothetical protein